MTDQDGRERRAREAVRRALKNAPGLFSKEGNRRFFRSQFKKLDVEPLVEMAREGDSDALEILREHARGARKAGMIVPNEFHTFVWEYFIDGPPKAKPGSSPKDTELRFQTIALLVKIASEWLPVYRNVEHRGEKDGPACAIKVVADEVGLAERTVEDIWGERKASVTRSV